MTAIARRRRLAPVVVLAAALLALGACGSDGSGATAGPSSSTARGVRGAVTVSAAASLTEAFGRMGEEFRAANPDARVTFNFGPSSTLATQVQQGAPADVFASADEASMLLLVDDGLVAGRPSEFARNELVIVTEPGNPEHVESLADLAALDVVALCGETVPCGKYAAQVLEGADVTIPPGRITRGEDVKATLAAVTTGDADAAIVYVTDADAAGDAVTTVRIPAAGDAVAVYPIAVLAPAADAPAARAFVDHVISVRGQRVLRSFGFLPPG
jgi:molybdate transport system substrate-binding protein